VKVTAQMLRRKHACEGQVAIFEKEWPDGAEVTFDSCQRAVALDLDISWFAAEFLPAPAFEAYEKARVTAWDAYVKARAPAWDAYVKATATALYEAIANQGL